MISNDPKYQKTYSKLEKVTNFDVQDKQISELETSFNSNDKLNDSNQSNNVIVIENSYYQSTQTDQYNDIINEFELIDNSIDLNIVQKEIEIPKKTTLISSKRPKQLIDYKQQSSKKSNKSTQKSNNKIFNCDYCGKLFNRKYHLTRHQQTSCNSNKSVPKFICEICGKTFTRNDNLKEHQRSHNDDNSRPKHFNCSKCSKSFHGQSLLIIHERTHTGEKPFKCDHCEKSFVSKDALTKHSHIHSGKKSYHCDICNLNFALSGTLNRHLLTHSNIKPYVCQYCKKAFIQRTGLKAHLFYHTGGGFKCDICGRLFNRKAALQMHLYNIHEKNSFLKNCYYCNKKFNKMEELVHHQKIHQLEKNKSYKCDSCSSSFLSRPILNIHKLIHRDSSTFKCNECNKIYLNLKNLDKHKICDHNQLNDNHKESDIELVNDFDDSNEFIDIGSNDLNTNNLISSTHNLISNVYTEQTINDNLISITNQTTSLHNNHLNNHYLEDKQTSDINNSIETTSSLITENFNLNLKKFLTIQLDDDLKQSIDWPTSLTTSLDCLIKKCGCEPIRNKNLDEQGQLRENLKLLFNITNDKLIKNYLDNNSIDDLLIYFLQSY